MYRNNNWEKYYKTHGTNVYSQALYFPESGLLGEFQLENWEAYFI